MPESWRLPDAAADLERSAGAPPALGGALEAAGPGTGVPGRCDHLVVGRGRIAGASDGWLELADIEAVESTERFWFWDDAETVLSYNPDGRNARPPSGRISDDSGNV